MGKKLVFSKIQKESIFCHDFEEFIENNEIEFSKQGIAVVYGPNGVGKTSLSNVLDCEDNTIFEAKYDDEECNSRSNKLFHKIADQNGRNIIEGKTEDFLLGDNIRKEHELKNFLDSEFKRIFEEKLAKSLKTEFNISKKTSNLITKISDDTIKEYIKELSNNKSKGESIHRDKFLQKIGTLTKKDIIDYDINKFNFLINDFDDKKSIVAKIFKIDENLIEKSEKIKQMLPASTFG